MNPDSKVVTRELAELKAWNARLREALLWRVLEPHPAGHTPYRRWLKDKPAHYSATLSTLLQEKPTDEDDAA
jgi:hypothetical protein